MRLPDVTGREPGSESKLGRSNRNVVRGTDTCAVRAYRVTLPPQDPQSIQAERAAPLKEEPRLSRLRLLLIDDEPTLLEILQPP
jgi:hypothetical protein